MSDYQSSSTVVLSTKWIPSASPPESVFDFSCCKEEGEEEEESSVHAESNSEEAFSTDLSPKLIDIISVLDKVHSYLALEQPGLNYSKVSDLAP